MKQLVGGTMVLFARLQKTLISVQHSVDIFVGIKIYGTGTHQGTVVVVL